MITTHNFNEQTALHIQEKSALFQMLINEVSQVVIGQQEAITFIQLAILSNGHILLEGVPGVAKTTLIKSVNKALGLTFSRIQFTPDLLPADVIGTLVYNPKTQEFSTKKGPIFANLVLADEINRAPAKVQSALLEAMQEHQVTIGAETFPIEEPFLVCATQNPLEQEGTYRLPEAQIDRFMFKIIVHYPEKHQERQILDLHRSYDQIQQILSKKDVLESQKLVSSIYVDAKIKDYIINIIFSLREPTKYGLTELASCIESGASPRATLALQHAAQAYAFIKGRHFVIPDDVKFVAHAVLRHRIILSYDAEIQHMTSDTLIYKVLSSIPTP